MVCATIAGLSGTPLARVLRIVGEARAISREEKALWRKLAATAMALCLAVGFALPHKAQVAVSGFENAHAVCIMRHCIKATGPFDDSLKGVLTARPTPEIPLLLDAFGFCGPKLACSANCD